MNTVYFGIDQTATIGITIGGANPSGTWDIKVSQIECKNPMV